MSKNQIIILNGGDIQEFEILKKAIDSNEEPFYLCTDKNSEVIAILIKKVEDIKKIKNKEDLVIKKVIRQFDDDI